MWTQGIKATGMALETAAGETLKHTKDGGDESSLEAEGF